MNAQSKKKRMIRENGQVRRIRSSGGSRGRGSSEFTAAEMGVHPDDKPKVFIHSVIY